jgi:hypothetical protein
VETEEVETQIEELENRLERLRSLYEQYFLGIEKIEPAVARKDVDRRIWLLRREQIRNTARRFRLQVVIQRYNTFQQYWQRICREIENGTYKRHVLRAERSGELLTIQARRRAGHFARNAREEEPASEAATSTPAAPASGPSLASPPSVRASPGSEAAGPARSDLPRPERREDFERLELELDFPGGAGDPRRSPPAGSKPAAAAAAPRAAKPPLPARPAPKPPPAAAGLSEERVRELHARLIDAKRQVNDSRSISVDGLKQRLAAAESKLRQQHGDRRIDFDVVIRDGKAVVKPILR